MKTSINVPDWLHDQVEAATPGLSFSEACRDALLLALPAWRKVTDTPAVVVPLNARIRMVEAEAALVREPDTRPAGRQNGARKSAPRRKAASAPGRRSGR